MTRMLKLFNYKARRHGVVTTAYPAEAFVPPEGSMGEPFLARDRCDICGRCAQACPTLAIKINEETVTVDIGLCIFCAECVKACPKEAFSMSREFELASKEKKDLVVVYRVK